MNWFDRIEAWIHRGLGNWSDEPEELLRVVTLDEKSLQTSRPFGEECESQSKVIEAFVRVRKNQIPIMQYLGQIAGLEFGAHDSDMRYGGYYYYTAHQSKTHAIVVPGVWLGITAPRRFKKNEWFYIKISCSPDDARFDSFPDYEIVPANRYRIDYPASNCTALIFNPHL